MNLFLAALWHTYRHSPTQAPADDQGGDASLQTHAEQFDAEDEPLTGHCCTPTTSSCKTWRANVQRPILRLVQHPRFDAVVTVLIILNTTIMMCNHHPIEPSFQAVLDGCNVCVLEPHTA
jgi:hypothetical protein